MRFLLLKPWNLSAIFRRRKGALRALVAFANTSGGVLLIGVEDGSKKIKGIRDVLLEEDRLANLISDDTVPKLLPSMEVLPRRKT